MTRRVHSFAPLGILNIKRRGKKNTWAQKKNTTKKREKKKRVSTALESVVENAGKKALLAQNDPQKRRSTALESTVEKRGEKRTWPELLKKMTRRSP